MSMKVIIKYAIIDIDLIRGHIHRIPHPEDLMSSKILLSQSLFPGLQIVDQDPYYWCADGSKMIAATVAISVADIMLISRTSVFHKKMVVSGITTSFEKQKPHSKWIVSLGWWQRRHVRPKTISKEGEKDPGTSGGKKKNTVKVAELVTLTALHVSCQFQMQNSCCEKNPFFHQIPLDQEGQIQLNPAGHFLQIWASLLLVEDMMVPSCES
ncbi:hypothetical protein H5410_051391 [Solanum commersonii]|uniref:Uncharacterized protein n=1 Tax=Solanum commersonii TaxID=4109 RepID=A0A9J5X0E4_SOLCO|nr:hypothetical protein H5410_051391 [Solanum commersonii]